MKRRQFIQVVGISSMALAAGVSCSPSGKKFKNWAWLRGGQENSDAQLLVFLEKLKLNNIDAVLPEGSNEWYIRLAPLCQKVGLDFHAWRWTMNRGGYMKEHPEWYAVNRNGDSVVDKPPYVNYYRWLCPSRPEVKQLLIDDYLSLCKIEGITGVHLDYVRYCDVILPIALQPKYNLVQDHEMAEFDYCYCQVCRDKFKAEHGIDPLELEDPSANKKWHKWRLNQLVKVVNAIADEVHKTGKEISAAVFPTPEIASKLVRQNWEEFNLDMFMPMIYFKDYDGDLDWVAKIVKQDAKIAKQKGAKLYAGLHMGHVREFGLEAVLETCIKNGADGVSFFTGQSLKDSEWLEFSNFWKKQI